MGGPRLGNIDSRKAPEATYQASLTFPLMNDVLTGA